MLKQISLIAAVWIVTLTAVAFADNNNSSANSGHSAVPHKFDICLFLSQANAAISALTPEGQQTVRQIFLDVQHESSGVIQKLFTSIRTENNATLASLQAAEGDKMTSFWNAIGFNNATAFSGNQVDWCQIQTDALASYKQMSSASQETIVSIAVTAMNQHKQEFKAIPQNVLKKDQALIQQLMKNEKMENIMALINLFRGAMF